MVNLSLMLMSRKSYHLVRACAVRWPSSQWKAWPGIMQDINEFFPFPLCGPALNPSEMTVLNKKGREIVFSSLASIEFYYLTFACSICSLRYVSSRPRREACLLVGGSYPLLFSLCAQFKYVSV